MKDFNLPEIRKYEVPIPALPNDQVGALLRKVFHKSFSIPLKNSGETLRVIFVRNDTVTKVAVSVFSQGDTYQIMRPVTIKEVNLIRELFLSEDESLVWIYDMMSHHIVYNALKSYNRTAYDISNFNTHFLVEKNISLPFEYAYSRKTQKNKGYMYIRGSFGDCKFLHLQTKETFPWALFKFISQKEFPESKTRIIFSNQTKSIENDFIIWQL